MLEFFLHLVELYEGELGFFLSLLHVHVGNLKLLRAFLVLLGDVSGSGFCSLEGLVFDLELGGEIVLGLAQLVKTLLKAVKLLVDPLKLLGEFSGFCLCGLEGLVFGLELGGEIFLFARAQEVALKLLLHLVELQDGEVSFFLGYLELLSLLIANGLGLVEGFGLGVELELEIVGAVDGGVLLGGEGVVLGLGECEV
ncbi:hypothetical protein, partial [Synechococcus sp. BA-124 BA4]|uniref:hypothetical protein n=1 Tax=Synechococcus sp. BA-124 BA4 TaxID=3110251 RepID=UPI002B205687